MRKKGRKKKRKFKNLNLQKSFYIYILLKYIQSDDGIAEIPYICWTTYSTIE